MTEKEQDQLYIDLGIKIREARENAGFKQGVFSQMLNLSRASIVNIEKGRQRPPLHLIYEIAKITHCDISNILPSRENKTEEKIKTSWQNKITESAKGNKETKEKLTRFLKEISTKNNTKDETISKKN